MAVFTKSFLIISLLAIANAQLTAQVAQLLDPNFRSPIGKNDAYIFSGSWQAFCLRFRQRCWQWLRSCSSFRYFWFWCWIWIRRSVGRTARLVRQQLCHCCSSFRFFRFWRCKNSPWNSSADHTTNAPAQHRPSDAGKQRGCRLAKILRRGWLRGTFSPYLGRF